MTDAKFDVQLARALRDKESDSILWDLADDTAHPPADLFSNDYLSLITNSVLRQAILDEMAVSPFLLGSGGARVSSGNPQPYIDLENKMKEIFHAPSALLFNTGYDANLSFFSTIPQSGDVIIYDQFIHTSVQDGICLLRASVKAYRFSHNSLHSLTACIHRVLRETPGVGAGNGTIFIVVESIYSMDGDIAPLTEIVKAVQELIPLGGYHIFVDESHSTGYCGPGGRGVVAALNLCDQVQTVLHTFSKGRAFAGAVIVTSPLVRSFLINFARPFMYSTSLTYPSIIAISVSSDFIMSPNGSALSERLRQLCLYFEGSFRRILAGVPSSILSLGDRCTSNFPEDVFSPIFSVKSPQARSLAKYVRELGYFNVPIQYPVVPRGSERIRVTIHAANTEEQLDCFISHLSDWARSIKSSAKL